MLDLMLRKKVLGGGVNIEHITRWMKRGRMLDMKGKKGVYMSVRRVEGSLAANALNRGNFIDMNIYPQKLLIKK